MRIAIRSVVVVSALAFLPALPGQARAQDVQYTTVTRIKMEGALGKVMSIAAKLGGGSTETTETTYIKGRKMRVDQDKTSTISDLDKGQFIYLDREHKTYTVVRLADAAQVMAQMMRQGRAEMQQGHAEAQESHVTAEPTKDGVVIHTDSGDVNVKFHLALDPTSQHEKVAGYDAERTFMTLEMQGAAQPQDSAQAQDVGQLVILLDTWNSTDIPAWKARQDFDQAAAAEAAGAFSPQQRAQLQGLAAAFSQDPRYQPAMEKAAAEAQKIEGMPVRTTMYMIGVAPGQEFNRDLALNGGAEKKAKESTGQKAKGLFGKALSARFGGKKAEQPAQSDTAQAQPSQGTLFTTVTEVKDVKTGPLSDSLFEIPSGYREVQAPTGN